jgi:flagellar motor switch protein FliN
MRVAAAKIVEDGESSTDGSASSLIDAVEVTLEAFLGQRKLKISEVRALKLDSVIALDASLGAAVELRLNGAVVARGELVSVGDKFGVRLTEIGR